MRIKRTVAILLSVLLILPTLTAFADDIVFDYEQIGALNVPVAFDGSVGITPEQLDAMAIDPQSWRLAHDTRLNPFRDHSGNLVQGAAVSHDWDGFPSYIPHPVIDWESFREGNYDQQPNFNVLNEHFRDGRVLRGAIILIEFPDRPMISGLPQGSEQMGNPQVDTGVWAATQAAAPEDRNEVRGAALREFWEGFLNESIPELNRTHNITGAWLEYTAGLWGLELDVFGPFMAPWFQFQYTPNTTWFNSPVGGVPGSAAQNAALGDFAFRGIFGTAGQAMNAWAVQEAMDNGVQFVDTETGENIYHFAFLTLAGYCQSPTWQEMGTMMFPSPYRTADGGNSPGPHHASWDRIAHPTIAYAQTVYHPVTREVLRRADGSNILGMEFTGYGHINRILDMVNAEDFDIARDWPNFRMTDTNFHWRSFVSSGANQAPFLSARTAAEGANVVIPTTITVTIDGVERVVNVPGTAANRTVGAYVAEAYTAFRTEFPASALTPILFRDRLWRSAFLAMYAEEMKFAQSETIEGLIEAFEIGDFELEIVDVEVEHVFEDGEMIEVDGEYLMVYAEGEEPVGFSSELTSFVSALVNPVQIIGFAAEEPEYSEMWLNWYEVNNPNVILEERLIPMLEQAAYNARTSTINPYFQAANQRYVQWASWYGSANVWSHAFTAFNLQHPMGDRPMGFSVQGEGTAMAVYSHELGHIVRLPDNDNMVYNLATAGGAGNVGEPIPARAMLGPWNIMARGAHVGYYGGHTRWNIPGIRAGSGGTGLMSRMRIGAGFTDLTVPAGPLAEWGTPGGPRNHVRPDPENSRDVLYRDYNDFRTMPPLIGEVFGRNMPVNRGILDYYGEEITGFEAVVIQGINFVDRTPGTRAPIFGTTNALRWANNLLGVDLNATMNTPGNRLADLPRMATPLAPTRIDPARWNWHIGGASTIQLGGGLTLANFGLSMPFPGSGLTGSNIPRTSGFSIDVIDRVGYDSFSPDHGVLISRIAHTNAVGAGGMDGGGIFIVDAHPGNMDMIQFREPDGQPYMFADDHHMNIATATFRAGVHNNPYFYREDFPERFLTAADHEEFGQDGRFFHPDQRPGVAGHTVNEWVDEFNEFHFYILARNNHRGRYGQFLSYEIAVRNTAPGAYQVGGELTLEAIGTPTAASPGNFSQQTFAITHSGDATASDIIRINLDGLLAETVMSRSPFCLGDDNDPSTWFMHEAHTMHQNAVILNNLYAIAPGETIYFDVFIRVPEDHSSIWFTASDYLDITVSSETNPEKYAEVGVPAPDDRIPSIIDDIRNELFDEYGNQIIPIFVTIADASIEDRGEFILAYIVNRFNIPPDIAVAVWPAPARMAEQWIVSVGEGAATLLIEVTVVSSVFDVEFISIWETGRNTRIWDISFTVNETFVDGEVESFNMSIQIPSQHANVAGEYFFEYGRLEGHTLVFDIRNNGSNIAVFELR